MADDALPLFVFGTLRRGEGNHHFLLGRYDRCLKGALSGFRRGTTLHGFPAALPAEGERIHGELFFITPRLYAETMRRIDLLEDLPPGQLAGLYYRRARVVVETDEGTFTAWSYVDPSTPDVDCAPNRVSEREI